MTIYFNPEKQSFTTMEAASENPNMVEITNEQHIELLAKLNQGYYVFPDLTLSTIRPSIEHHWIDGAWVDPRTPEQKEAQYMASLKPLTRRQFKLTLLHYGMLETMESQIASIPDANLRIQLQIEYAESTTFMRTSPSVAAMVQSLGLTTNQVNQMWEYGMSQ
jgi:hypothetical protein